LGLSTSEARDNHRPQPGVGNSAQLDVQTA